MTDTKNCIMSKLSQCDPLHFVMVKSFMFQSIQNSGAPECNFLPEDPATVLPVHYSIAQCQQFSSMTTDVTRTGLCNSIGQYLQCMSAVDQADLPLIWRGILGRNVLIWQKWWYLGCQLSGRLKSPEKLLSMPMDIDNFSSLLFQKHFMKGN